MPTAMQIQAQELLDAHNAAGEARRKVFSTGGKLGAGVMSVIGLGPAAPVVSGIFGAICALDKYFDSYRDELERVIRGERDTLPEPPAEDGSSDHIACS
jgi:hypothetical protein